MTCSAAFFLSRYYKYYLCAGAAGAGAGAGGAGGAAGAPGAGAGAPGAAGAGAAASFLAGSGGFFSGADGQPTNVNVTATTKRIDKMIASSFLIDSYLLCEKSF
jgi:hypothetical protein